MAEIKHVGRVKSTGKKCIVAYRTLPGDAYNCLIIPTESLPDSYHDALINLVESNAGQTAHEFAEVMARSTFPDGSIMLAALHTQGRLIKASTDQIEMLPNSYTSIVLSELNQFIAEQRGIAVDDLSIKSSVLSDGVPSETAKTTLPDEISELTPEQKAKKYRSDADRLSKEAAQLRRMADEIQPPVKKSKTETVAETVVEPVTKPSVKKSEDKPVVETAS